MFKYRRTRSGWRLALGAIAAILFLLASAHANDWPCYRGDVRRNAVVAQNLVWPLQLLWTHTPAQPPAPAWPEPGREAHRLDFDFAFHVAVAGDRVFYGSSADDTVRALELKTGRTIWRFTTGGPVRFAPHIDGNRCCFAADDGIAYCLDAATGALIWRFQAAPWVRLLPGNSRLISRWPCRTGAVVFDGKVYVTAGMWPSEGIFIYALDEATGRQIWCNDTSGNAYVAAPHEGAWNMGGVAPQGYLLATEDLLIVPTGRHWPAFFDRRTGKLRSYMAGQKFGGGALVTIVGGTAWVGGEWARQVSMPWIGESEKFFRQRPLIVGPNLSGKGSGWKDDVYGAQAGFGEIFWLGAKGSRTSVSCQGRGNSWNVPAPYVYASAIAGDHLLLGCEGKVMALDRTTGRETVQTDIAGEARGIAVADGCLLVSTEKGAIQCFGPRSAGPAAEVAAGARRAGVMPPTIPPQTVELLERIRRAGLANKGYALILGAPDAALAEALANSTLMTVIAGLDDAIKVQTERDRLLDTGNLYGARISVLRLADPAHLPFPQYCANLVVVCGAPAGLSGPELYRILAPCGGLLTFCGMEQSQVERLLATAGIPAVELRRSGDAIEVRRGKLEGAFDWDSQITADQRLKWPLELLWFGGPGPDRVLDRHEGGSTPVPANGRYFVPGKRHVIAVDAYNGTEIWSREVGRGTPLTADDDTVYLNRGLWLALDARNGELKKTFGLPRPQQRFALDQPRRFILKVPPGNNAYIAPLLRGPRNAVITTTGVLEMRKAKEGLECVLTTSDGKCEGWWLSFDFRPVAERAWYFGPKTFQYHVDAVKGKARAEQFVLEAPDAPRFRAKLSEDGRVTFTLPWDELRRILGDLPADFTFAACVIFKGGIGGICPEIAPGYGGVVNDGWGRFVLDPSRAGDAPEIFRAPADKLEDSPRVGEYRAYTWQGRLPKRISDNNMAPDPAKKSRWTVAYKDNGPFKRTTLTGEIAPVTYRRAHGCGGYILAATMDFFRSGSLGFYDLEDDSGTRNFAGIRPGCGVPAMPALGIVICSEASAGCVCSYNFQTSLALAPTSKRRHEDWAVFFDNPRQGGWFQRLALNLGAPGDRRDNRRVLWLGYPRPQGKNFADQPLSVALPVTVEGNTNMATWRFNADRTEFGGTDRPWIYASGYRGLKKIAVDLRFYEPGSNAVARSPAAASMYTVRLHFAEPDDIKAGRRVFDVRAQGKSALSGLDVAGEAGGPRRALVKEFRGVPVADILAIEFESKSDGITETDSPTLCGLEIIKE